MQTIRANFQNMLSARKTIGALKSSGFSGAHLDVPDAFNTEFSNDISFLASTHAPSLSALVLRSDGYIRSPGKGALIVSDPMVSGMGSSCEIRDNSSTSLIINVNDDENSDKVKEIINEFGGSVLT